MAQLHALGVEEGDTLLVHSSYRALRPIEDGPTGVIEALMMAVGPTGTVTMPSWTDQDDEPFDRATTSALHLGVVADSFWRQSGVVRSDHCFAFAAAGRNAQRITSDPLPIPPHGPASPVGRVRKLDGRVLLLGVDHDSNTTVHRAELLAGVPYSVPMYCTVVQNGRKVRVDYGENNHCCTGFKLLDGWLRERRLQREGIVGRAAARLVRARDVVDVVCEHLLVNPTVFLHPRGSDCSECEEAWASVRR
ncbi:MAG: AAC(3) family N-acetyltransferase [Myxococcaceae bacterium]